MARLSPCLTAFGGTVRGVTNTGGQADSFVAGFGSSSSAQIYEDILVPRLFAPCAITLLIRLGLHPGETLLDVACGTGIVVRFAAPVLGAAGRVVGRDVTPAMVEVARCEPARTAAAPCDWGLAPADAVDLPDGTADVVTCQQGLQFFADPDAAVREMHRVLRSGGRVGIAVWHAIEECPLWAAAQVAAAPQIGAERAAQLNTPFSWPGEATLVDVLERAGFADLVTSPHTIVMHFEEGIARRP